MLKPRTYSVLPNWLFVPLGTRSVMGRVAGGGKTEAIRQVGGRGAMKRTYERHFGMCSEGVAVSFAGACPSADLGCSSEYSKRNFED